MKKVVSLEQKLEVLKDYIQAAIYKKWLNNIVVGHTAVCDCNREGKMCAARGSNEGTQEIKKKIMKKCEYGDVSEDWFLWLTQHTGHFTFRNGSAISSQAV